MKAGQTITIIPSNTLQELRLNDLVGRKAVLVEKDRRPKRLGWWVALVGAPYLEEQEWFIPSNSIMPDEQPRR